MNARKKILIVEDEPDLLTHMTILLSTSGYDTISASNGVDGYKLAQSEHPDLITLDIFMPEQSGLRTLKQLKENETLKHIPVIITTASGLALKNYLKKREDIPEPEGFMIKPIDEDRYLQMVEDLLSI